MAVGVGASAWCGRQSGTSVGFRLVRRVVTGVDGEGASVFVSGDDVAPLTVERVPGASMVKVGASTSRSESDQPCTMSSTVICAERRT